MTLGNSEDASIGQLSALLPTDRAQRAVDFVYLFSNNRYRQSGNILIKVYDVKLPVLQYSR